MKNKNEAKKKASIHFVSSANVKINLNAVRVGCWFQKPKEFQNHLNAMEMSVHLSRTQWTRAQPSLVSEHCFALEKRLSMNVIFIGCMLVLAISHWVARPLVCSRWTRVQLPFRIILNAKKLVLFQPWSQWSAIASIPTYIFFFCAFFPVETIKVMQSIRYFIVIALCSNTEKY